MLFSTGRSGYWHCLFHLGVVGLSCVSSLEWILTWGHVHFTMKVTTLWLIELCNDVFFALFFKQDGFFTLTSVTKISMDFVSVEIQSLQFCPKWLLIYVKCMFMSVAQLEWCILQSRCEAVNNLLPCSGKVRLTSIFYNYRFAADFVAYFF